MIIHGISRKGLVRENNEDFYCYDSQRGLLIVADGIGGHAGGEVASKLAVETAAAELVQRETATLQAIEQAFHAANMAIVERAADDSSLADMGTTMTLAWLCGFRLLVGHIGDSRAYLFQSGQLQMLTRDHTVAGDLLEAGDISDSQAATHPQKHILTRALGTVEGCTIDVFELELQSDSMLLLCTDGLTDQVSTEEISHLLNQQTDIKIIADSLVGQAYQKGAPDNVTLIVARSQGGESVDRL